MASRAKILVVDSDMDTLSRIYLALVHRHHKVEASDKAEEIPQRIKRLKPELIIFGKNEYLQFKDKLRIFGIVLLQKEEMQAIKLEDEFIAVEKPVHIDALMRAVEKLIL